MPDLGNIIRQIFGIVFKFGILDNDDIFPGVQRVTDLSAQPVFFIDAAVQRTRRKHQQKRRAVFNVCKELFVEFTGTHIFHIEKQAKASLLQFVMEQSCQVDPAVTPVADEHIKIVFHAFLRHLRLRALRISTAAVMPVTAAAAAQTARIRPPERPPRGFSRC